MSNQIPGVLTHVQKVKRLYKRVLMNSKATYSHRHIHRYHCAFVRQAFEANRHITDPKKARELVQDGETLLKNQGHLMQIVYPTSPNGTNYQREINHPDWVLDYWDPLEKAQYPEYFARREQRKEEFVKLWVEKYGESTFKKPFFSQSDKESAI